MFYSSNENEENKWDNLVKESMPVEIFVDLVKK